MLLDLQCRVEGVGRSHRGVILGSNRSMRSVMDRARMLSCCKGKSCRHVCVLCDGGTLTMSLTKAASMLPHRRRATLAKRTLCCPSNARGSGEA